MEVTRREFIKAIGAGAAGLVAAAVGLEMAKEAEPLVLISQELKVEPLEYPPNEWWHFNHINCRCVAVYIDDQEVIDEISA
jgi:anaerobic selenocysteine-containing dehydrogenase